MAIFLNGQKVTVMLDGKKFKSCPSPSIPSEYQAVEWIRAESGVGAYIDLGFAFDTAATIYLTQWVGTSTSSTYPFGSVENSGALRCCISSPYSTLSATLYGSNGSAYIGTAENLVSDAKNELRAILKKGQLLIENITSGDSASLTTQAEYTMASNLYLFAQNYNGSPRFGGVRQLGKFQYYDKNNTLICNITPCYRKSDGAIGVYDKARKIFLTNAGSGTFTKGKDTIA